KIGRAKSFGAKFRSPARLIAIAGQGIDWKRILVKVVLQVKHAGKACSGEIFFAPRAIRVLLSDQICGGPWNRRVVGVRASEQSDQTPSSLRRGAVSLPLT